MDPLTILSVAGKALPIFGKLFGRKKETNRINYKQLRNDAQAAGFNPLTALRAGGGAGYQVTSAPQLSTAEFLGAAISDGLDLWTNQKQGEKDAEEQQARIDLMREELAEMKRTPYQGFGYTIPNISDKEKTPENPVLTGLVDDIGQPERDVRSAYGPWKVDPSWDPAEKVEQEYAEVGSWPYAAAKMSNDLGWNLGTRYGAYKLKQAIRRGYQSKKPPLWTGSMGRTAPTGRFEWKF